MFTGTPYRSIFTLSWALIAAGCGTDAQEVRSSDATPQDEEEQVEPESGDEDVAHEEPTDSAPVDADGDGFAEAEDCDDKNPDVHPSALEVCDGVDNDCDGEADGADSDDATEWFLDSDDDGYGDSTGSVFACTAPEGYVASPDDCDDDDENFHPGAIEDCADPNDYNCDGSVGFVDSDNDGYAACEECNDADGSIHPDAIEVCDEVDNDCDTQIDDDDDSLDLSTAGTWYSDDDEDGFGSAASGTVHACTVPAGMVASDDDCDDNNPAVHPGAEDICDALDNDCDASTGPTAIVPTDYPTIQGAEDAAVDSDWICVLPGTYQEGVTVDVNVRLEGQDAATTIIDGGGATRVMRTNDLDETAKISGFTLANGYGTHGPGLFLSGSNATYEDLWITNNHSVSTGQCLGSGVLVRHGSNAIFNRVRIHINSATCDNDWGSLMLADSSALTLTNSSIIGNRSNSLDSTYGAGIQQYVNTSLFAYNLVVAGNQALNSDGDFRVRANGHSAFNGTTVVLQNVTYANNHANAGTGKIDATGLTFTGPANVTATNVTVSGHTATGTDTINCGAVRGLGDDDSWTYSNVYGNEHGDICSDDPTGTDGNVSVDPSFVNTSDPSAENWDLNLAPDSALIAAGNPNIAGLHNSKVSDIGAFGGEQSDSW